MRLPVTIVTVALALGCAPAKQGLARVHPRGALPAASAEVAWGDAPAVLARAAAVLEERGLRVATRAPDRIVSAASELDVPCGASTCLARELVVVRVAGGTVRVEILRGLWEPAERSWIMALAPAAAEDAAAQEAAILRAILRGDAVGSAGDARGR